MKFSEIVITKTIGKTLLFFRFRTGTVRALTVLSTSARRCLLNIIVKPFVSRSGPVALVYNIIII